MTPFAVVLLVAAEDDLAAIWLASPNPAEVTDAEDELYRLLATDPFGHGTHVAEGLYRCVLPPLVAYYAIDPVTRTVEVARYVSVGSG